MIVAVMIGLKLMLIFNNKVKLKFKVNKLSKLCMTPSLFLQF